MCWGSVWILGDDDDDDSMSHISGLRSFCCGFAVVFGGAGGIFGRTNVSPGVSFASRWVTARGGGGGGLC